jgi:hypothetical protein
VPANADQVFVAWAAGFFDGEGCIVLRPAGKGRQLWVSIGQKDVEPLRRLHAQFGGSINLVKNGKWPPYYQLSFVSQQAFVFLVAIEPHLVVKRSQAQLAIEFQQDKPTKKMALAIHRERAILEQEYAHEMTMLKVVNT